MSGQYAELAGSLATVAIASLGGPVPALGAGLAAMAKYAQAKYLAAASTRDLHRQVTSSIEAWANSEHIDLHNVQLGITLATTTIAAAEVTTEEIASLGFDPGRVSKKILDAARAADPKWGTEEHYAVAEAAVAETYGGLIPRIKSDAGSVIPTLQSLRASIEASAEQATVMSRSLETGLNALMEALISASSVAEVMLYLRTRIKDWDVSVWHPHGHAPSRLEQRLLVRSSSTERPLRELNAAQALVGQRMLVVLGGPGSGKSWLARRYAREVAQVALKKLETGDDLHAVELPLLTTWDQWSRSQSQTTPIELRTSLVAASFAAELGNSDLGGRDITARLQRTLTDRGVKVLLIMDSLDEAAERSGRRETGSLRAVASLRDWRLVVTSRPAAWDAIGWGEADRPGGPLVVELQDLIYPYDVNAFIQAWFCDDPVRCQELIEQIRNRHELQLSAVVPLILTFYCVLAEQRDSGVQLLPSRRRQLYKDLIERLLSGEWAGNSPGPDPAADVEDCEDLLRKWAWHAVHNWVTPAGLGNWGDEFEQPARPRQPTGLSRAIDHVAPKSQNRTARVTRRFVHRTVLEHFVAEHIATLETEKAADVLTPHLWFDADWEVAAPAAIAAHNIRLRGALFQRLLARRECHPAPGAAERAVKREFDRLLLGVAQESEPDSWTPEHQTIFHECRTQNATDELALIRSTAHWEGSNLRVRKSLLAKLRGARPDVTILVGVLQALQPTETERAEARAALLVILRRGNSSEWRSLIDALMSVTRTDTERAEVRTALMVALAEASPSIFSAIVRALLALEATDTERDEARTLLSSALPKVEPQDFSNLVDSLMDLTTTAAEMAETRTALLTTLPKRNSRAVRSLIVDALMAVTTTSTERIESRIALLATLPDADPRTVCKLVDALMTMDPTDTQRAEARTALLAALPHAEPWIASNLLDALKALDPTDTQRSEARTMLVNRLRVSRNLSYVSKLVDTFVALEPTDTERAEARTAMLASLPNADPGTASRLVDALMALGPTDIERAEAHAALLAVLRGASPSILSALGPVLRALEPTGAKRTEVHAEMRAELPEVDASALRVLKALKRDTERAEAPTVRPSTVSTGDSRDVGNLVVDAVMDLEPTDTKRAEARTALLATLPTTDPWTASALVDRLMDLDPTDTERAEARSALLALLPKANSWDGSNLMVEALMDLTTTDIERAEARTVLVSTLRRGNPADVRNLVDALIALEPIEAERAVARTALLSTLPSASPRDVSILVDALPALTPTATERAEASDGLLAALPRARARHIERLVSAARAISSVDQWLHWLGNPT